MFRWHFPTRCHYFHWASTRFTVHENFTWHSVCKICDRCTQCDVVGTDISYCVFKSFGLRNWSWQSPFIILGTGQWQSLWWCRWRHSGFKELYCGGGGNSSPHGSRSSHKRSRSRSRGAVRSSRNRARSPPLPTRPRSRTRDRDRERDRSRDRDRDRDRRPHTPQPQAQRVWNQISCSQIIWLWVRLHICCWM